MEILTLTNTTYNKNQYQRVIDTSFTQLVDTAYTIFTKTIEVSPLLKAVQHTHRFVIQLIVHLMTMTNFTVADITTRLMRQLRLH